MKFEISYAVPIGNQTIMMDFIKADIQRYFKWRCQSLNPPLREIIKLTLVEYGFQVIVVYRFGSWIESKISSRKLYLIKQLLLGLYYILNFLVVKMYDIRIDRKAIIGKGLYIGHFSGIYIPKCIIGENCSLHQRVQIEGNGSSTIEHLCQIGNNVWIGPHAIIKKGVKIGDGASIAAGSVVFADIERKSLAIGNPARILKRNYNNSKLLGELTI